MDTYIALQIQLGPTPTQKGEKEKLACIITQKLSLVSFINKKKATVFKESLALIQCKRRTSYSWMLLKMS